MRRYIAAVAVTLAVLLPGIRDATPAWADAKSSTGFVYRTGDADCTEGNATTDHGPTMAGYSWSYLAYTYAWYYVDACAQWWHRPPGNVAVKVNFYRWTGSAWGLCAWTDWIYNGSQAFNAVYGWNFGSPPCGAGYYLTQTGAYNYNGGWNGGWLNSEYHYYS